jgi:pimeloyl-ACP methyl ester carboxylesterase
MESGTLRRQGKRLFVWLFVIALLGAAGGLVYAGTPLHGTPASVQAVEDDSAVTLDRTGGAYVLQPASGESTVGLVFYPGGRVHPDAYVASLAPLARQANATVIVPKMPLNLAVLDQGAASPAIDRYDAEQWLVGGHSLGGVMACRYAANNPDRVDGVLLFASYCDRDLSGTDLAALTVTGEADTVLDRGDYEANSGNLPPDAVVADLPGVNHTQFGAYRGQSGDTPSGTSYTVAHRRLASVTVPWVQNVTARAGG